MIGSEGLGRVFIGPSCPFGMVKPGPDCTANPNSGWLPEPTPVTGFAPVHVSGTGGGPKYGNILLMPFSGPLRICRRTARPNTPSWATRGCVSNQTKNELCSNARVHDEILAKSAW